MTSTPPSSTSTATMKQRKNRKNGPAPTAPTNESAFRNAERYWKNRASEPDLTRALSCNHIQWEATTGDGATRQRGIWFDGVGTTVECFKVPLNDVVDWLGQTQWKGKHRQHHLVDYAVIIPSMPGLVLLPSLLPPPLQRSLVRECLRQSLPPNLTSLSPHYALPPEGIWNAFEAGRGETLVERISPKIVGPQRREQVNFDPVHEGNWKEARGRGLEGSSGGKEETQDKKTEEDSEKNPGTTTSSSDAPTAEPPMMIKDLLPKLRWTTIGWNYDWTSKVYDFDIPHAALPPLIHRCCRNAVRSIPWHEVFEEKDEEQCGWKKWEQTYNPDAGIVNFYQIRDTLTAHIDHSEVDAVQPLVSFSIGHSAVFLVGGPTRETTPLAILLRSGDGLIMSGREGRRVFHGIPRILPDSLPEYLKAGTDDVNEDEDLWRSFGEFLEPGARININVRTVFSS